MVKKISEHISYKEATFSETAKKLKLKNKPSEEQLENMKAVAKHIFEPLREWVKKPIRVNSFFRSEEVNTAIKGSLKSLHMQGQAIDIDSLGGKTNAEMFLYIKDNLDFDQLIWEFGDEKEPNWLHVSYKNKDDNRKQVLQAYRERGRVKYRLI